MREGDRFDSYILKEKIAEGGMAEIFRAERTGAMNISREVCVKCIRPALCTDAEFVRMFIDEARISSTLRHSNVVSIDHFGSHDGALFSVMEWVHGTDASKVLKRMAAQGRALPVDVALFVTAEVLKALEYAHGKTDNGQWLRIVHRDVTPHNVMLSYSGEVKLTDFGIAKATSRLHHTQGDVVKGKVAYMAPEQAMGGALDHRTDLFAVGVVAFELLAGRRPFAGATQVDGVHAMLKGEHPSLRALRPEVSPEVDAFVERLLAREPDDRFADAGAALDAIQHIPALATGQRALQRLMRELYADVQHSTVLPRFTPASKPVDPPGPVAPSALPDATAPMSPSGLLGVEPTSSAPTVPRRTSPPEGVLYTAPLAPADRTQTAARDALAPTSVAPVGATLPTPPRASLALSLLAAVIAAVAAVAWVTMPSRTAPPRSARDVNAQVVAAAPTPPLAPSPTPSPDPAPRGVTFEDAGLDAGAPPRSQLGTLTVSLRPWGTITVAGMRSDSPGTFRLPPGRYRVVGSWNGRRAHKSATLRAGGTTHVIIDLER